MKKTATQPKARAAGSKTRAAGKAGSAGTLHVLGCGEAFDTGLGNNSCLLYDGKGGVPTAKPRIPTILFDCGYQIPERLWALPQLYSGLDAVALTHFHADHAFGLAPLLVRFVEEGRQEPLVVFGPKGAAAYCGKLLELAYPGVRNKLPFDMQFCEFTPGESVEWGGLKFRTARSTHSVLNLALRVDGPGGLSFAVSGDGNFTPETLALYDGVGCLLHETYMLEEELDTHAALGPLARALQERPLGRIGLTHLSRDERPHLAHALKTLRRADPRWFALEPGMEIAL